MNRTNRWTRKTSIPIHQSLLDNWPDERCRYPAGINCRSSTTQPSKEERGAMVARASSGRKAGRRLSFAQVVNVVGAVRALFIRRNNKWPPILRPVICIQSRFKATLLSLSLWSTGCTFPFWTDVASTYLLLFRINKQSVLLGTLHMRAHPLQSTPIWN